jgi:urea transport system substrate-binding protein
MRRWLAVLIALAVLSAVGLWFFNWLINRVRPPIVVGLLHSQSGPMEISERSMIDAEILALREINAQGGLLGRRVDWTIADGQSDWPTFAREATRLIDREKVSVIFGCWTSASRKSVKPVVEQRSHLLIYPMAYEGLEVSPNIVYTGAAPNQQVIPAVSWCHETLKARRFFLVGSDYIWPHCVNEIAKDQLNALGAECVGVSYILFGSADVNGAIEAIRKAKPDVIISTVVGDSNEPFYRQLQAAGILPEHTPVLSFSIAEDELRKLPLPAIVGDYAAWNYFQTVDRPENRDFIQRFQAMYGTDRVTSDVIVSAYDSVYLWAQAVQEAGTDDVAEVLKAIRRQSLNAAEGIVSVDEETQHTWRPVYVGKIRSDGQFDVVWSSGNPVRPIPFPRSRTEPKWRSLLEDLHRTWGGWANPGPGGAGQGDHRAAGLILDSEMAAGAFAADWLTQTSRLRTTASDFSARPSRGNRP